MGFVPSCCYDIIQGTIYIFYYSLQITYFLQFLFSYNSYKLNKQYYIITIDEVDLKDVVQAVISVKAKYYALGRMLGIHAGDLDAIMLEQPHNSNQALSDVLRKWLNQEYKTERYGLPTWRSLVEAVDNEAGGGNHALAKQIAQQHPAGMLLQSQ